MEIAFTFRDTFVESITGERSPYSRVVKITLTQDQKEALLPLYVGVSGGKDMFEDIVAIHIEKS